MNTQIGTNTNLEHLVRTGGIITDVLTYSGKKAHDYEWCEQCANYIKGIWSDQDYTELAERYKINFDLANGRGDRLFPVNSQAAIQKIEGQILSSGTNPVRHVPEMTNIYSAMVGEEMRATLKFTAVDASRYSTNMRQKKRLELNQQWIQENIISRVEQEVAMQVMIENGVRDQSQLSPEDQQDLFADIDNRVKFRLVEDIDKYMSKEYRTPVETEVQKITDWLVRKCDLKYHTDENFKNVIITGFEGFRFGIRNNDIYLDNLDPIGVRRLAGKGKQFLEDSDIIQYKQDVSYQDIMTWHGTELLKGKWKKKLDFLKGNYKDTQLDRILSRDTGPFLIEQAPPINTEEGQRFQRMLATVFGSSSSMKGIEYTDYVFKAFDKLKVIKRKTNRGIEIFYLAENYQFNPNKGDLEESVEIVPNIYTVKEIGLGTGIFVEKGQLPYAYRSKNNPFSVKMNYVGAYYNTIGGNSDNLSPIDLGKPYQHKINIQLAKIEELDRKNYGTPLAISPKLKPKNTSWAEWFNLLKNEGILLHDDTSEGLNANDLQSLRGIPLTNVNELQARQAYVEYLTNKMSIIMGFNPSRLGVQDPNTSVTNNRQNIVQSTIQTEHLYRTHNKIIENLINAMVNVGKVVVRENPVVASYILDDMSIAELSLDVDLLDIAEQNIKVTNSIDDQKDLDAIRALAQPYIQNGIIDFEDSAKLMFAKNGAEMLNVAIDSRRKNEARMQQQQEIEQKTIAQQQQFQQQLEQFKQQLELEKQARELQTKITIATLDSMKFANQFDIDKDGLNDQYEINLEKIKADRDKLNKEIEIKEKELKQNKELKLKEIEVKKIQARKPRASGS